ncbi:MAG: radical SAM protein [Candidatus Aminicenantes bacterium]|nr:radical SAM protein [Candidatus Aminicenantes bacterium]
MGKISRRTFLKDSLIFTGSSFVLSPEFLPASTKSHLKEKKIRKYPSYLELEEKGLLSERVKKLHSIYESCHLCPRDCRVDRTKGETGKCEATSKAKVSSAFPHFGEEAPLIGKGGSGTIFFSNCGLRCVFCQNYKISIEGEGVEISDERLADMMIKLQKMGCHNINLVTPTHYVPNIVNALQKAIGKGLHIPLVYNTSGYETLDTLQLLDGIIDIYLPDCKFMNPENAAKYTGETYNYPYYAKLALKEMHRQVGVLQVGKRGIAVRGIMIRHLILPNNIAGTDKFLKFVAENFPKTTYLNLMSQYRPEYKASEYPELSRRIKRSEYAAALRLARKYGLTRLDK